MQIVRSSYGLFGIIYEVTYKIKPLTPMHVHHKTYSPSEFIAALPEIKALGYSVMYYMFPFDNKITVEFRKYNPEAKGEPNHAAWALRNHIWGKSGPKFGHDVEKNVSNASIRYGIIDAFNAAWRLQLENIVSSDYTIPGDQIIDYPPVSDDSRYTFSLFAFPEDEFPAALTSFYKFCNDYYKEKGYRSNLLYVGYRIAQDQKALLSYSYDETVMTLDPVSTANPGWEDFLGGIQPILRRSWREAAVESNARPDGRHRSRCLWGQADDSCRYSQAVRSQRPAIERLFPYFA